jgi:magnesium transporter
MNTIFVHRNGRTEQATEIDRGWLNPASGVAPVGGPRSAVDPRTTDPERHVRVPSAVGRRRESAIQYPKAEAYDGYLYIVLHGIDFHTGDHCFRHATTSTSFSGRTTSSRSTTAIRRRSASFAITPTGTRRFLGEGAVALFHRIVDAMVDSYRPEVEKLEDRLDELEKAIFESPDHGSCSGFSKRSAQVASLRGSSRRSAT